MGFDLVTGYAIAPFRVLAAAGLLASLLAFVASSGFLVYRFAVGDGVSGLVSAFAAVFFLLGIQLTLLAALSEYVGRIHLEAQQRPYYIVAEVTRADPGVPEPRG